VRRRATLSAAVAATLMLATTGCTFVAEIATLEEYDPSDGVGTTVGDVQVRNMLALSEDGERVALVFAATNTGPEDVRLNIGLSESAAGAQQVAISGGDFTSVGTAGTQLVLEGVNATLGSLLPVYVQYGDEPGRLLQVPVIDGSLPEYQAFLPTATPTPTPTPAATKVPVNPDATADPQAPVEPGTDQGTDNEQTPTDG
jgi:hypothetical protein